MEEEVHTIAVGETLSTCPSCGYGDGFHVTMSRYVGKLRIVLVCPECHSRFDPGWCITLEC